MKNPIFFWTMVIFGIANIIDAFTAMFILPGEANPLYLLTGTIWSIIILKGLLLLGLYAYYKRNKFPSNFTYFFLLWVLVIGTVGVSLGAASNIYGMMNPSVIEAASNTSSSEKLVSYGLFTLIFMILPTIFPLITFKLYDMSVKHADINPTYFKKKVWWKRW